MTLQEVINEFLEKITHPKIDIDNFEYEWTEPDFGIQKNTETLIRYNSFENQTDYKKLLHSYLQVIFNIINESFSNHKASGIKLAVSKFLKLPLPESISITPNYNVNCVAKELEDSYKFIGYRILLTSNNQETIRQFNIIGNSFYLEFYNFLKNKYEQYIQDGLKSSIPKVLIMKENAIQGFGFSSEVSDHLYMEIYNLWNGSIISSDFVSFRVAFSGQLLTYSPNIKWLLTHRKHLSYTALIYFLSSSIFNDIPDDKIFKKAILTTFVDGSNVALKVTSLDIALSNYNKKIEKVEMSNQKWKKQLDTIIQSTKNLTKVSK